jgi:hypothetical protein
MQKTHAGSIAQATDRPEAARLSNCTTTDKRMGLTQLRAFGARVYDLSSAHPEDLP